MTWVFFGLLMVALGTVSHQQAEIKKLKTDIFFAKKDLSTEARRLLVMENLSPTEAVKVLQKKYIGLSREIAEKIIQQVLAILLEAEK